MALDEALMDLARAGVAMLRFYTWEPHCLSLGRNQSTPERVHGRPRSELRCGEDVVRRPTGGRSVYHGRELTYSVTAPDRLWGGPRSMYGRINRALRRGLASLGAALDPDPGEAPPRGASSSLPRPTPRQGAPGAALGPAPCFEAPAAGEVTAGGRKLVGSAQWRHRGVLLQHGSVLLVNEQARGDLLAETGDRGERSAIGLAELVPGLLESADLIQALSDAFGAEFGCRPEAAPIDPALDTEARRLENKYRSEAWTWRR